LVTHTHYVEGSPAPQFPPRARALISLVVLLGMGSLFIGVLQFESSDPVRFLSYLVLAVLAAGLRVDLPTLSGTLSINFLFILIGLVELTLSEVLVIGTAMTLVQCLLPQPRRPIFIKTIFNVAVVVLAIFGTALVYYFQPFREIGMNQAVLLMLVSVVLFLFVTVPVAAAMAWTEGREVFATWKECNLWSLPYYLAGAAIAGVFTTLTHSIGWQLALLLIPIIYLMVRSYQLYVARVDDSLQHAEQMAGLHLRTIEALALAIEAKDQTTADHLERVQTYAVEIGKEMNLPYEQLEAIRAAALLHDIGKLAVPEHILSKPGKLTPEEFDKMKIHPIVGAEIIERAEFPYPVAPIVRSHHERWNGEGYPDGLVAEQIPIGARILSAVDCLDALSTDRQYRRALPLAEAMDFVQGESGKAFDPAVVEILARRYVELEQIVKSRKGSIKELTTNIKVERGRPAAGFAETPASAKPVSKHQQQAQKLTFLDTIACSSFPRTSARLFRWKRRSACSPPVLNGLSPTTPSPSTSSNTTSSSPNSSPAKAFVFFPISAYPWARASAAGSLSAASPYSTAIPRSSRLISTTRIASPLSAPPLPYRSKA
jgi:putative nucleotidyltransferase with HDIG domain